MLVLKAMVNGLEFSRFGFIISKRIDKRAVTRNRMKRLMREVVRLNSIEPGWDVVVIARKGSVKMPYRDVEQAMLGLLRRAKLVKEGS